MKRKRLLSSHYMRNSICSALLGIFCVSLPASLFAEDLYVEVQSVKLRSAPKAWSQPTEEVRYGDKLTVLERIVPWLRVRSEKNLEGFIHESAVTVRKPLGTTANVALNKVHAADVVLAGKGFSDQVLAEWERSNPQVKMSLVDDMEKRSKVPLSEVVAFIKKGDLNLGEKE